MHYFYIATYLILINIIAALICALDKRKARKGGWRIPEQTLFMLVFFGGGIGMYLTMKKIRHKTKHKRFMIGIPIIVIMQCALIVFMLYKLNVF